MRKRKRALSVLVLALLCLCACAGTEETVSEVLAAYDGTWYFAKTGAACVFGDGKIYQDDLHSQEGQTLTGIYREADDHIEANLAGVGGVSIPRPLYIVQSDNGDVLCDSPDGDGTIYYYRDALSALAALEELESSSPEPVSEPSPSALPAESDPAAGPVVQSPETPSPLSDGPGSGERGPAQASASAAPENSPAKSVEGDSGAMVWIPKSGSKYHSDPDCSGMNDPTQVTQAEAERRGYEPCKRCY